MAGALQSKFGLGSLWVDSLYTSVILAASYSAETAQEPEQKGFH